MRIYDKKTIPEHETKYLKEIRCDLCGAIGKEGKWESSMWQVNETEIEITVRQKEGWASFDGGSGTKIVIDICPACFKSKLVLALRVMGAKIEIQEWDF